jgi:hypothetical protein
MGKIKDVYGISTGVGDKDMVVRIRRHGRRRLQHINGGCSSVFVPCDELERPTQTKVWASYVISRRKCTHKTETRGRLLGIGLRALR